MSDLTDLRASWEGLAETDALWAILSDPRRKDGRWDPAEFFETGVREIAAVDSFLRQLNLSFPAEGPSLDFGCGVGRLTQPIASRAAPVVGVDISQHMIDQARRLNRQGDRCQFICSDTPVLPFPSDYFNFIYSNIVLQHIPTVLAQGYIAEFLRTLRVGGLAVFQLCDANKGEPPPTLRTRFNRMRVKLALGTRLRAVASKAGIAKTRPLKPADSFRYTMNPTSEAVARAIIAKERGSILDVRLTNATDDNFNGDLRFPQAEPEFGYVSKLYTVTRT